MCDTPRDTTHTVTYSCLTLFVSFALCLCLPGFCCAHSGFDCERTVVLCVDEEECLCIRSSWCCAAGVPDKGVGCVTEEDECCKIGLYCCNWGLLVPKTICRGASQCLCCYSVKSFPCHEDYVKGCVCAIYGVQISPKCGICGDYGDRPAMLDKLVKGVQEGQAQGQQMER